MPETTSVPGAAQHDFAIDFGRESRPVGRVACRLPDGRMRVDLNEHGRSVFPGRAFVVMAPPGWAPPTVPAGL